MEVDNLKDLVKFVGFCGNAYAGKSTSAAYMKDAKPYRVVIPFAFRLKEIARNVFGWDGRKDEKGRRLLQLIGTEVAREYNPNFWVNAWKDLILETYRGSFIAPTLIIADDVRFDNEAQLIRLWGGSIVEIVRPEGPKLVSFHASEVGVHRSLIDQTVMNSGTLEDLRSSIESLKLIFL